MDFLFVCLFISPSSLLNFVEEEKEREEEGVTPRNCGVESPYSTRLGERRRKEEEETKKETARLALPADHRFGTPDTL